MEWNQTRQEFAHSERKGNFFFPSRLIFVDCTPTKDPLELGSDIQALGDLTASSAPSLSSFFATEENGWKLDGSRTDEAGNRKENP